MPDPTLDLSATMVLDDGSLQQELPVYQPLPQTQDQGYQVQFIPSFPDFDKMSCDKLGQEIADMISKTNTEPMSNDVLMAFNQAISHAQQQYILKCGSSQQSTEQTFHNDLPNQTSHNPSTNTQSTFKDDKINQPTVGTSKDKHKQKDLKPYIYLGLGIVAILLVARLASKK
jgi:hypothetical protein